MHHAPLTCHLYLPGGQGAIAARCTDVLSSDQYGAKASGTIPATVVFFSSFHVFAIKSWISCLLGALAGLDTSLLSITCRQQVARHGGARLAMQPAWATSKGAASLGKAAVA